MHSSHLSKIHTQFIWVCFTFNMQINILLGIKMNNYYNYFDKLSLNHIIASTKTGARNDL